MKDKGVGPDKKWMLAVLSTVNPNHQFFNKDYRPERQRKQKKRKREFDNEDGFFDMLPKSLLKKAKRSTAAAKMFYKP